MFAPFLRGRCDCGPTPDPPLGSSRCGPAWRTPRTARLLIAGGTRNAAPSTVRPNTTAEGGRCSTATRMNKNELPQMTEVAANSSSAFRFTVAARTPPARQACPDVSRHHSYPHRADHTASRSGMCRPAAGPDRSARFTLSAAGEPIQAPSERMDRCPVIIGIRPHDFCPVGLGAGPSGLFDRSKLCPPQRR
jgi:hypothetical protein